MNRSFIPLFIITFDYSIVGSRIDTRRILQQLLCTTNGQIGCVPKVRCSDDHKAFGLQNTILVDPWVSMILTYFWSADINSLQLMFSLMSLTIITYPAPGAFLTLSEVCCCVSSRMQVTWIKLFLIVYVMEKLMTSTFSCRHILQACSLKSEMLISKATNSFNQVPSFPTP